MEHSEENTNVKIVYVASTCSEAAYAELFADVAAKPSFQAQKYNRLFIEGLAHHTRVDVVGFPPANPGVMGASVIALPDEAAGGAHYHYLKVYRNRIRKLLSILLGSFAKTYRLLDRDTAVVLDCLNQTVGLGALAACWLRGCRCVGIVTDLPVHQAGGMKLAAFLIRHCTDYVVLTRAMNERVNPKGKPYVVLEGHADVTMEAKKPSLVQKASPRICMYAGSIHKIYGIAQLVEGFRMAAIPNTQLHIYGSGDYLPELEAIAAQDPSVVYGGMLLPSQVVEKEREATLLVNPRPTNEEFVKYSFPSKTMEYLSTGTPVLTTMLPGLPEEYAPHVFFIREETAGGIAQSLREVLSHSDEALFEKGCKARDFILKERNNVVQAEKVLAMLKGNAN